MDTNNSNKKIDATALVSPFKFGPFTLPSRTAVAPHEQYAPAGRPP